MLIRQGLVLVNEKVITKTGYKVDEDDLITVTGDDNWQKYVARSAFKLAHAFEQYPPESVAHALDIGASTWGFTQVLLERWAKEVVAVEIGKEQLHESLRYDARVTSLEQTDIRKLSDAFVNMAYDVIVCDVSFVSLIEIMDDILELKAKSYYLLYKPQFDLGPHWLDRHGVVRDIQKVQDRLSSMQDRLVREGYDVQVCASWLAGEKGNQEWWVVLKKGS